MTLEKESDKLHVALRNIITGEIHVPLPKETQHFQIWERLAKVGIDLEDIDVGYIDKASKFILDRNSNRLEGLKRKTFGKTDKLALVGIGAGALGLIKGGMMENYRETDILDDVARKHGGEHVKTDGFIHVLRFGSIADANYFADEMKRRYGLDRNEFTNYEDKEFESDVMLVVNVGALALQPGGSS